MQAHLAAGAEAGLAAALQGGEQQEGQGQGQQQEGEWVYLDPALLRQALQGDS